MQLLKREQIRHLLGLLELQIVAESGSYVFAKRVRGYGEGETGKLQAALSIMLEMAKE